MDDIQSQRVAQATLKGYKEAVRQLQQQDRQIRAAQARAENRRLELEPNEVEAEALDRQRHEYFSDWSRSEQEAFKAQQDAMWAQIPVHLREKAQKMATGQWFG